MRLSRFRLGTKRRREDWFIGDNAHQNHNFSFGKRCNFM